MSEQERTGRGATSYDCAGAELHDLGQAQQLQALLALDAVQIVLHSHSQQPQSSSGPAIALNGQWHPELPPCSHGSETEPRMNNASSCWECQQDCCVVGTRSLLAGQVAEHVAD